MRKEYSVLYLTMRAHFGRQQQTKS